MKQTNPTPTGKLQELLREALEKYAHQRRSEDVKRGIAAAKARKLAEAKK